MIIIINEEAIFKFIVKELFESVNPLIKLTSHLLTQSDLYAFSGNPIDFRGSTIITC